MERDKMRDCLEQIDEAIEMVKELPYRLATKAIHHLDGLRDIITEDLPGGLFGPCSGCGTLLGNDDDFASEPDGDGYFCKECCDEWSTEDNAS